MCALVRGSFLHGISVYIEDMIYGGTAMVCSFSSLRNKEIVNVKTGIKIGYADDLELDTSDSSIVSIIVYGRMRAFGLIGRDDDIIIKCTDIVLIGEDTILVELDDSSKPSKNVSYRVDNLLKMPK